APQPQLRRAVGQIDLAEVVLGHQFGQLADRVHLERLAGFRRLIRFHRQPSTIPDEQESFEQEGTEETERDSYSILSVPSVFSCSILYSIRNRKHLVRVF